MDFTGLPYCLDFYTLQTFCFNFALINFFEGEFLCLFQELAISHLLYQNLLEGFYVFSFQMP